MSSTAKTDIAVAGDGEVLEGKPLTVNTLSKLLGGPTIPKRWKTLGEAITGIKYGEELGLAPLESLYRLYMVNGGIAADSKSLNALIHRAGHVLQQVETSATRGAVKALRRDPYTHELIDVGTYEFTWDDAERAGLAKQDTYQDYPADMLYARAISRAAKFAFPDVTTGMLLPEEIGVNPADIDNDDAAFATVETMLDADYG